MEHRENKKTFTFTIPPRAPYEGKATQKQKHLLWQLDFKDKTVIDNLGKSQASSLINQILSLHEPAKRRSELLTVALIAMGGAALIWLVYTIQF